ncbi:glycosyltransferase [Schaalia hyovaginalis]|uniref:glycosyltransferase family protein n=1 Tax=Schaalia hyovaginalis TaxID=29316 RepID=UPI002A80299C|nr:glycosyltransferase [Schaalia hyovaginalis]MDY3665752.1 hypothetical protein [Schaalia hyovaginalis]
MSETSAVANAPLTGSCLLYGDVNLNIIDGSAIWLTSMARVLSACFEEVHVLLKAPVITSRLVDDLIGIDNIRLHIPSEREGELGPRRAAQRIADMVAAKEPRAVIARGRRICAHLANSERCRGILWAYMTDVPHVLDAVDDRTRAEIDRICAAACRLFAQTEDARAFLESQFPSAAGKTLLLPPMIPASELAALGPGANGGRRSDEGATRAVLSLGYAGKFARSWMTEEMCALPMTDGLEGRVTLELVGDKFQDDPRDPQWAERMRKAVESPGVHWHGGLGRLESMSLILGCDLALSFRTTDMDGVHELSTKVLEYCAVGVPPVVNKNRQHVDLFGEDYPFFVVDGDYVAAVRRALDHPEELAAVRERLPLIAERFSITGAQERVREAFARALLERVDAPPASGEALRVLLASHDFKFCGELIDGLTAARGIDLKIDKWTALAVHDEAQSRRLLEWADVIICEWCGPNAVWYSQHKRAEQRLLVRLHRFELDAPWMPDIDVERVDTLICVSQYFVDRVSAAIPQIAERIRFIPNMIDCADLARPKTEGAEFRLAIIGVSPIHKRLDRALDLIAELVRLDPRYVLHIKGRYPSEYPWLWRDVDYHEYFSDCYHRILTDPAIRDNVSLDYFSPDAANWLRGIGWVLSPSTEESFHLAPMEGMASGALPVIWERPGAADIFGREWLVADCAAEIARSVHRLVLDEDERRGRIRRARSAASRYDRERVIGMWLSLIFGGDRESARRD